MNNHFSRRCIEHSPQVYAYLRQCQRRVVDSDCSKSGMEMYCTSESTESTEYGVNGSRS